MKRVAAAPVDSGSAGASAAAAADLLRAIAAGGTAAAAASAKASAKKGVSAKPLGAKIAPGVAAAASASAALPGSPLPLAPPPTKTVVWAKGTGYGHGSTDAKSNWDPAAHRQAEVGAGHAQHWAVLSESACSLSVNDWQKANDASVASLLQLLAIQLRQGSLVVTLGLRRVCVETLWPASQIARLHPRLPACCVG